MEKEPWEEKIVNEGKSVTRKTKELLINTNWLTAILSIFFVAMLLMLIIVFYTSNGGSNKETETSGFYKVSSSSVQESSSGEKSSVESSTSQASSSSSSTEESSSEGNGDTITVLAGEGAGSIASRAGISVSELEALNPSHMTQGYWYANPGDEVYIN